MLDIPDVNEAVDMYQGSLQIQSLFGTDPLSHRLDLVLKRDDILKYANPSPEDIFSNVVSVDGYLLKYSLSN